MSQVTQIENGLHKLKTLVSNFTHDTEKRERSVYLKTVDTSLSLLKETELEYSKEDFIYIRNFVCGLFDGLTEKPIRRRYLNDSKDVLVEKVEQIIADIRSQCTITKIVEKPKAPKKITLTGDWKDSLTKASEALNTITEQKERTVETLEITQSDTDLLTEVRSIQYQEVTEPIGIIRAPIACLGFHASKLHRRKFKQNYNFDTTLQEYTIIKDMTLLGINSKLYTSIVNGMDSQDIFSFVNSVLSRRHLNFVPSGNFVTKKNVNYIMLVPKELDGKIATDSWNFCH